MAVFIIRRSLQSVVVLLAMSLIVFVGVYAVGNPIDILINPQADQRNPGPAPAGDPGRPRVGPGGPTGAHPAGTPYTNGRTTGTTPAPLEAPAGDAEAAPAPAGSWQRERAAPHAGGGQRCGGHR